jgi:leucyl-tRNA---protein transferase
MNIKPFEYPFYLGHSHLPCPYLADRQASLLFLDSSIGPAAYRQLLDSGYRRHGVFMYRPDCPGCSECKILRVPVMDFRRSKEQRRVWNRAEKALTVRLEAPAYHPAKAALYRRYLHYQHAADEIIDEERYQQFFVDTFLGRDTKELQLLDGDTWVGIGILDIVEDAVSSVYFFFDPDYAKLSPGTFSALVEIELAKAQRCRYYYLGYYIAGCPTMNYKVRFSPYEIKDCEGDDWCASGR